MKLGHIVTLGQRSHRYPGCFKTLRCRTELFRNSFLPFTVNEWNKLDSDIKNSDSYEMFRKKLLAFLRPVDNSMYGKNNLSAKTTYLLAQPL